MTRPRRLPMWLGILIGGALFAGLMVLFHVSRAASIGLANVLVWLAVGGLLAVIQAVLQRRRMARSGPADGPLSKAERNSAAVAVRAGQPPADERIRYAARALAQQLVNQPGQAPRIILYLGLAVIFGVMAVLDSPWWALVTLALLVITPIIVRAEQRRREAARIYLERSVGESRGSVGSPG
ncbi:MAG TPA: hypothetical protein VHN18_13845 [Micromonosporaceae bacterium]|nr:hypothetical protein [Micromonosporaceae bacterium]